MPFDGAMEDAGDGPAQGVVPRQWAEPAPFARAVAAAKPGEAVSKEPAPEERAELVLHAHTAARAPRRTVGWIELLDSAERSEHLDGALALCGLGLAGQQRAERREPARVARVQRRALLCEKTDRAVVATLRRNVRG